MTVQFTRTPAVAPPSGDDPGRSRRGLVLGVVVALLAAALVVVLVGVTGDAPEVARPSPAAPSAQPTAEAPAPEEPAPAPPAAATEPVTADSLPPALPEAALDAPVDVEGVTAALAAVQPIEARATGRGNVAGPALLVSVRLTNGGGTPLDLAGVTVNLSSGADRTPGSPVEDARRAPLGGILEPGASAEGTYAFSVPVEGRDVVTVEVAPRPGAPIAVFSGPVG
jgi:hypothetical protein